MNIPDEASEKTLCFLQKNAWLDEVLEQAQKRSWGFISVHSHKKNSPKQSILSKYKCYTGKRIFPDQTEEAYLLFIGIEKEELRSVAKSYGQSVAIFGEQNTESNLIAVEEVE